MDVDNLAPKAIVGFLPLAVHGLVGVANRVHEQVKDEDDDCYSTDDEGSLPPWFVQVKAQHSPPDREHVLESSVHINVSCGTRLHVRAILQVGGALTWLILRHVGSELQLLRIGVVAVQVTLLLLVSHV